VPHRVGQREGRCLVAKHPSNPLERKFISSLQELDQVKDPALKALGRRALSRYYGVREWSGVIVTGSWIALVAWLQMGIFWLGVWRATLSEVMLFLIYAGLIGLALCAKVT
jgi:hypothetical protein